jgi:starvation-inducible DNA-binding protein
VLAARIRLYGWNVVGPQFVYLHQLFRDQYRALDAQVDVLGERIRALGGVVPGNLADLTRLSRLPDRSVRQPPARDMVAHLLVDHQTLADHLTRTLAEPALDSVTRTLLTGLLAAHEQMGRLLRACIESPSDAPAL